MNYTVTDKRIVDLGGMQRELCCPRGELLIKSATVFEGYYKADKTVQKEPEYFTEDGYFRTGDIAEYNPILRSI